ncbi:MAG: aromatic acid exporter family protein [Candidatus Nanopelagicales bacterium]
MPDRDPSAALGLSEALQTRNRGLGRFSMALRVAVATTASYFIAERISGSTVPLFAPVTTLLVVQASPFSTLGMTAQRVLGTGLGVAAATLYVTFVPITWWSVLLAVLVSLLVARALPLGIAGQLQLPLATVFVLALGPGDLSVDLWRVADVLLGGLIGVITVFVVPPRPQLEPARRQLEGFAAAIVALLESIAAEVGTHAVPLPAETRHAYIADTRDMRTRTQAVIDAMTVAVESVRFNPRARGSGTELDLLDQRTTWLRRVSIQARGLGGAIDRLYDRSGPAPALPPDVLAALLRDLGRLLTVVDRDGVDEDAHGLDVHLVQQLTAAVAAATASHAVVDALASLSILGRVDHLRALVAAGPLPVDDLEAAPEDEPDEAAPTVSDRVRRMLGLEASG